MHILLIHQAFASLDEPGGTRHHEFARELAAAGHRITIIASPISYLTGKSRSKTIAWRTEESDGELITILRAYTYSALHRSFIHRVFSFFSFMISSFLIGLGVDHVDVVWGTSPPMFQGVTAWMLARLKGAKFLFEVRDLWPAFAIAVGVLKNRLLIAIVGMAGEISLPSRGCGDGQLTWFCGACHPQRCPPRGADPQWGGSCHVRCIGWT